MVTFSLPSVSSLWSHQMAPLRSGSDPDSRLPAEFQHLGRHFDGSLTDYRCLNKGVYRCSKYVSQFDNPLSFGIDIGSEFGLGLGLGLGEGLGG